ncbi:Sucraseferredoxin family protein [Pseudofrankia inefficax]|uniref:Sucraseferredoxin family protein n=2 Tax=Pseudofrankia inefficax (strain DSM 45817 / CECT 9037 / DDB 130130 / EuI1c) TaxID=298654 RepID=E3J7W6_PSEI1|nr:Sucraseferredoxin family protein [Pseudofrankia inefficax]
MVNMTWASPPDLDPEAKIRCSEWSRAAALSPVATSGTYPGFLLLELPLPWPGDIGESPEAAAVAPLLSPAGYRVQAVVPSNPDASPEERRVVLYARSPGGGPFTGYRRFERAVGPSLPAAVADLLAGAANPESCDLEAGGADVLVCGHGQRDSCCGRLGAGLATRLAAAGAPEGVTYRRTSHLGGHRFAATFLVLPEGTAWAYGDEDLVETVLRRKGDVADVAGNYRGCCGLGGPQVQALELEVLRRVGWSLLDSPRSGSFDGSRAELACVDDAGATVTWSADVARGRAVPTPDCQRPPSSATKSQIEWAVSAVTRD